MNFTFWQRWRGNFVFVAFVLGVWMWLVSFGPAPEQAQATQSVLQFCAYWLAISAVWCFINQLRFERKMREFTAFQHRIASGEFDS